MASPRTLLRLLAPFLVVAACGGGRSGTGISESVSDLVAGPTPGATDQATQTAAAATASGEDVVSMITGNVSLVRMAALHPESAGKPAKRLLAAMRLFVPLGSIAHAGNGLDGITVTVQGTNDSTETDPQGFYSLDGGYSGPIVLHFDRAEDGVSVRMEVSVPKGGSLSLHDMTLDGSSGLASADRQNIGFDGVVVGKNCVEHRLRTASRFASPGPTYTVDLSSSALRDSSGDRIRCLELHHDDAVQVTGLVQPSGIIGDGKVVVDKGDDRAQAAAAAASSRLPQLGPPPLPMGAEPRPVPTP